MTSTNISEFAPVALAEAPTHKAEPAPAPAAEIPPVVTPDFIRALTPIVLAAIGGGTAILLLVFNTGKDKIEAANFTAGMAFAGTTITAAAALAQPGSSLANKPQPSRGEAEPSK